MDSAVSDITGLVLAGGMARRMGGQDKGLVLFAGKPMAQLIADRLSPQCQSIMINANRSFSAYREFGYPVIADDLTGFQGPLAGMFAGLNKLQTQWMATVPCDGPFLADDYVKRMIQGVKSNGHDLAVAACDGRLQPVYTLINQSLTQGLRLFLNSEERKIDKWFVQQPYSIVDFSDTPEMFENVNTLEQLKELECSVKPGYG